MQSFKMLRHLILYYIRSIFKKSIFWFKDNNLYEVWKEKHWPHLVTVLEQFPSCTPDAAVICTLLPMLHPRFYSVSSSSKVYPNELHLTVGIVQYFAGEGKVNYGVCSNFLNTVEIGSNVACFVRK